MYINIIYLYTYTSFCLFCLEQTKYVVPGSLTDFLRVIRKYSLHALYDSSSNERLIIFCLLQFSLSLSLWAGR